MDNPIPGDNKKNKIDGGKGGPASETGTNQVRPVLAYQIFVFQSPPPAYNELFRPPPPYGRK